MITTTSSTQRNGSESPYRGNSEMDCVKDITVANHSSERPRLSDSQLEEVLALTETRTKHDHLACRRQEEE
jgi:hypothetical protein